MDLSPYRELAGAAGPFATVYLDVSHDTAQADEQIGLRWQSARAALAAEDADEATLAVLDQALAAAPPAVGRAGRALVASADRLWLDEPLRVPPPTPVVHFGELPDLVPLLAGRAPGVTHLVAVVDRSGAELRGYPADGPLRAVRTGPEEAAAAIGRMAAELDARLIVLSGDLQTRAEVHAALPRRCASLAVEVPGARDVDAVAGAVQGLVASIAAGYEQEVEDRFAAEMGRPGGQAVSGLAAVTSALRMSTVDTLLLDPEVEREREVWVGDRPTEVGVDREELADFGVPSPRCEAADAALVRASAASGAQFQVVPGLRDGVAALLRG